jgi:predicted PurR-regulated permease PerM
MTVPSSMLLASFAAPMQIDTSPLSMLWLLPLVAAIAIVYKATKVHKVRPWPFIKESAVLFGSILVFILLAALILYVLAWVVTEQFPNLARQFEV